MCHLTRTLGLAALWNNIGTRGNPMPHEVDGEERGIDTHFNCDTHNILVGRNIMVQSARALAWALRGSQLRRAAC